MKRTIVDEVKEKLNPTDLAKPAIAGLIVLVVMVAVVAGRSLIETATAKDFAIEPAPAEQAEHAEAADGGDASTIFVHVTGCVKSPGLVELEDGSRVADAVRAAGGFGDDARSDSVNLARQVKDGEQIVVLSQEEEANAEAAGDANASYEGAASQGDGKVNINTATAEQLQALPGVGPATAQKIVAYRTSNGAFSSVEDLKRVSGIGDKKYAQLADSICV